MSHRPTNPEVIQTLYRTFRDKDFAAFEELCSPDLVWIQNEGFPGGGTHRGPKAVVRDVFQAFGDAWESWAFETEEMLDAGDSVVVLGHYAGKHRESGKSFRSAAAHVFDLAEGKVTRFRQFADTKVIWDATA